MGLACGSGLSTPQQDMDLSRAALADLGGGTDGLLRVLRPRPTAAFSRRDSLAPGFPDAAAAAAEHGFAPVIRPAGGRLAAYHRDALVARPRRPASCTARSATAPGSPRPLRR